MSGVLGGSRPRPSSGRNASYPGQLPKIPDLPRGEPLADMSVVDLTCELERPATYAAKLLDLARVAAAG